MLFFALNLWNAMLSSDQPETWNQSHTDEQNILYGFLPPNMVNKSVQNYDFCVHCIIVQFCTCWNPLCLITIQRWLSWRYEWALEKRRRLGKALGSRWIKGVSSGEPHSPPPTTSSHAGATNCDQCGQEINIFLWHEVRFKTKLRRWPQSF